MLSDRVQADTSIYKDLPELVDTMWRDRQYLVEKNRLLEETISTVGTVTNDLMKREGQLKGLEENSALDSSVSLLSVGNQGAGLMLNSPPSMYDLMSESEVERRRSLVLKGVP
ncbi:unnamed protein product [Nippostrongylus brasiliensis]|uniref:Adenomatous polyposis coli protein 2 n=1 Tax=Nippostrongylus brasiliensis TaxID=27835 RepID=A0A0N4Y622_NIPBR|nr:hypothetical protein Q1695_012475 [Nippostrongylus brasiliensis]VDL75091.1 unnamed protein product [Nippostrongylus brasiliensis]